MSSDESDVEDVHTLTINEHYAKAFQYKNEQEELSKLEEKYGSDSDEQDETEEEAESEDEDGEELTPAVDAAILRTLARIKRRDPEIYLSENGIFEEEQKRTAAMKKTTRVPKDKSKPLTMRQAALDSALKATSRSPSPEPHPTPLPHAEEQRALRSETIAVFHNAANPLASEDEVDDNLFVPREKTKDEREREEEEYRDFLEREVGEDLAGLVTIEEDTIGARAMVSDEENKEEQPAEGKKKKKKKKKSKKGKGKEKAQETDHEFLMNYILNRGWIDRSVNRIPTYHEVTASSNSKGKLKQSDGGDISGEDVDDGENEGRKGLSDDEAFDEIAERFETSYNFRYEEPDAAVIKGYPRNLPSLVRREDTTRKDARERKKQRKEEELAKKREEVKRLKGLKMKDLRAKLELIGKEGGKNLDETKALQELDLEADWDPEVHDQQMAALYGDDGIDDGDKPQWDDDIDMGDIYVSEDEGPSKKQKKKKKKKGKDTDDEDAGVDVDAMDADVDYAGAGSEDEEWDGTEEMRKRKLDEYMNDIYGLDFNDIVGDIPTRFKYTPVQPQSFALTPSEILMATDTELNQYLSMKKYAPYRKDNNWDKTRGDRLKELKQSVAERSRGAYGVGTGIGAVTDRRDANAEPAKKRKGKKERMKMKAVVDDGGDAEMGSVENEIPPNRKRKLEEETEARNGETAGKKKRRRHKKTAAQDFVNRVTASLEV